MARKRRDRSRATVAGKPAAPPNDSLAAESDARWKRLDRQLEWKAIITKRVPSPEMRDAVVKAMTPLPEPPIPTPEPLPPPPEPSAPLLKTWLTGAETGYREFPKRDSESIKGWTRRLADEAQKDGVRTTPGTPRAIETRIHGSDRYLKTLLP